MHEALVTLRAHRPAPAHVEMAYVPLPGRLGRALLVLAGCWTAIPLVLWIPPHYPWLAIAFCSGLYFSYRQWAGRYRVSYFAGLCPRCGHSVSMGVDRCISLPHTLTCYHCHFEPRLEVRFAEAGAGQTRPLPIHRDEACVGRWEPRWLADDSFLVCTYCRASCESTPEARAEADAENGYAELLERLTQEGRML